MKLRQHRLNIYARMHAPILESAYWQRVIDRAMVPTAEEIERSRALLAKQWEGLAAMLSLPTLSQEVAGGPVAVHPMVEEFLKPVEGLFVPEPGVVLQAEEAKLYTVSRVKDGEVVLTTADINEATALLEKHHRQKKAKLQVFCSEAQPAA